MQKDIHPHDIAQFGLNIYQYGHEVCASQHSYGPAVRQHYLIHYVISGGGTLFAGDRRWPVRQGKPSLSIRTRSPPIRRISSSPGNICGWNWTG